MSDATVSKGESPPEDVPIHAAPIEAVYHEGKFSGDAFRTAMILLSRRPDRPEWAHALRLFLLFAGIGLLVTGVIFFFAYNWAAMHRFAKLGVLEAGIAGAALFAWFRGLDDLVGKSMLLVASLLIGPLLAVYGQIYQTGADPYELFLGWALLAMGWVLLARLSALWIVWLLIVNVTVVLYGLQILNLRNNNLSLHLLLFGLNAVALVIWETLATRGFDWMQTAGRWAQRLLFSAALYFVSTSVWYLILSRRSFLFRRATESTALNVLSVVLYVGFAAGSYWLYRRYFRDLFPLAALVMSVIILDTTLLARIIDKDMIALFTMSLAVIVQAGIGVYWLRQMQQAMDDEDTQTQEASV